MILLRVVLWVWFFCALAAGHFLWLQHAPTPVVPVTVIALSAIAWFACSRIGAVRDAIDRVDLRALVLLHVTRFVGFYFLHLYSLGELPYGFAVPGGIGDIVVATLALAVVLIPLPAALRDRALYIWNVVGFVDIILVVFSGARLGLADPDSMRALTYLPLSLLPTFLVPLIITTHLIIFQRLKSRLPAS